MIRERVLMAAADKAHLVTTNERAAARVARHPAAGAAEEARRQLRRRCYKALLSAQGMSPEMFEARMRQDATQRQVLEGMSGTAFGAAGRPTAFDALLQQRDVRSALRRSGLPRRRSTDRRRPAGLLQGPENAAQFQAPSRRRSSTSCSTSMSIRRASPCRGRPAQVLRRRDAARYTTPKEQPASHILVKAEKSCAGRRAREGRRRPSTCWPNCANARRALPTARKNNDDPAPRSLAGPRLLRPRRDGSNPSRTPRSQAQARARSTAWSPATSATTSSASPACAA